ncbi:MAG: SDR family oxidoreductase [Xanthomonadales bacterium]|nr:SDR family oxidoreductase [Xanthomonadales bacterium]
MDLGLREKRAIITGATQGIGRKILEALIAEGCTVATCSRSPESVEAIIEQCSTRKAEVIGAACDVKDQEEYEAWIEDMVKQMDGVDIFIPNVSAGGGMDSEKNWWKSFEVDMLGTVRGCEAVIPHMKESGGGAITLISSSAAVETFAVPQAYNAMKAAVITYGKQLSQFVGVDNIRVNMVSPGPIEFPGGSWDMLKDTMPKWYAKIQRDHPTGRLGKPEEVAKAVVFLSSPAASWINGANLMIDGGFTKRVQF